jgi:hypothetical protein
MIDIPTILNDPPHPIRQAFFQMIRNDWTRIQCLLKGVDMDWKEIDWVLDENFVSTVRPVKDYECLGRCRNDIVLALRLPLTETFIPTTRQKAQKPLGLDDYLSLIKVPQRYHKVLKGASDNDFETATKQFLEIINSDGDLYTRLLTGNVLLLLSGFFPWTPTLAVIDKLKHEPLTKAVFLPTYQSYLDGLTKILEKSWKPTIKAES